MIYLIITTILFLVAFRFIQKKPDFFFWLFIILFIDPGGYFFHYITEPHLKGYLKMTDMFFLMSFAPLLSKKIKIDIIFDDKILLDFLKFLALFLVYHIVIYGFAVPFIYKYEQFSTFIIKERQAIFGFFIMIPAYIFAKRSLGLFFNMTIITTAIIVVLYIITVTTGFELMYIKSSERYDTSGIMRNMVYWSGNLLLKPTIYIALIVFVFKVKIKNRILLYLSGAFMVLILILSLTKIEYFYIFICLTTFLIFIPQIFKERNIKIIKHVAAYTILILLIVLCIYPSYIRYTGRAITDIYLTFTTGKRTDGSAENRFKREVPQQINLFKKHMIFGTGYKAEWYDNDGVDTLDGSDTPLIAGFAMFGIIGIIIFSIYYFKVLRLIRRLYLDLKNKMNKEFFNEHKKEVVFVIAIGLLFIAKFANAFYWYLDLIRGKWWTVDLIYLSILLAFYHNFRLKSDINIDKDGK